MYAVFSNQWDVASESANAAERPSQNIPRGESQVVHASPVTSQTSTGSGRRSRGDEGDLEHASGKCSCSAEQEGYTERDTVPLATDFCVLFPMSQYLFRIVLAIRRRPQQIKDIIQTILSKRRERCDYMKNCILKVLGSIVEQCRTIAREGVTVVYSGWIARRAPSRLASCVAWSTCSGESPFGQS